MIPALELVHGLGMQTCTLVNSHPAFGIFQGFPDTRVELFFEKQLNMCLALGVEHGLHINECRRRVQQLETMSLMDVMVENSNIQNDQQ
jgi:hypothetical protein